MAFVYKADPDRAAVWTQLFARQAPRLQFRVWPDVGDPKDVRFLAAWLPPDNLAVAFPNLEVLFSVGAGVDQLNLAFAGAVGERQHAKLLLVERTACPVEQKAEALPQAGERRTEFV